MALTFSATKPVYLNTASSPRLVTIETASATRMARVRGTSGPMHRRQPAGLVGQPRQPQQHQAADVVHAAAEEHDHRPDRVGPAVEDVAGDGDEGGARAEREHVVEQQDQRQEVEEEDVGGEDHRPCCRSTGRGRAGASYQGAVMARNLRSNSSGLILLGSRAGRLRAQAGCAAGDVDLGPRFPPTPSDRQRVLRRAQERWHLPHHLDRPATSCSTAASRPRCRRSRPRSSKLGFRFQDIKYLLASHAHVDHVQGHARVRQLTGAKVLASEKDAPFIAQRAARTTPYFEDRYLLDPLPGRPASSRDGDSVEHRRHQADRPPDAWPHPRAPPPGP